MALNFFMEKTEFPREEVYDALNEIFCQRSLIIAPTILRTLGADISVEARPAVPHIERAMTHLLVHMRQHEQLIEFFVHEQLQTTDKREIFRENTLASMLVQWSFRLIGQEYLKNIFGDLIVELCNSGETLEIDPVMATEEIVDLDANIRNLSSWSKRFNERLVNSLANIPESLKNICAIIRREVLERYHDDPEKEKVCSDAVSNFLVLRYAAHALVSPVQYQIVRESVVKTTRQKRNLVLIAKMMQAFAYGTAFKNAFAVVNDVIAEQHVAYVTFIENLKVATSARIGRACSSTCKAEFVPLNAFSEPSLLEDAGIVIKYLTTLNPDQIVKDSLQIFYPHMATATGKYSEGEMMEMLQCFTRLKWIIATDWFSHGVSSKPLAFPKKITRIVGLLKGVPGHDSGAQTEAPVLNDISTAAGFNSVSDWFERASKRQQYVVLVFYRGFFCTGCKQHLAEWSRLSDVIRSTGGQIYGVTAESAEAAVNTRKKWKLNFDLVSDPDAILASRYNIHVEDAAAGGWSLLGDYKNKGLFSQPAILCVGRDQNILYFWRQIPTFANIMGGTGRPVPVEALTNILETFEDFPSTEDSSTFDESDGSSSEPSAITTAASYNSSTVDRSVNSSPLSQRGRNSIYAAASIATSEEAQDLAELIKGMDRVTLHRLLSSAVQNDELAVSLAEEMKALKKTIEGAKKRVKKSRKSVKKVKSTP
eukprot:TRINITY_DN327_c0_g1_i1.p1 TRINITY_DN327_c0_g1~~TRINITY_DN327_c0_g1_i1.p1  ORF type:complete len:761 (-),score=200.56 TRINITY_DN327_c0_g1_i1:47-2170(-)